MQIRWYQRNIYVRLESVQLRQCVVKELNRHPLGCGRLKGKQNELQETNNCREDLFYTSTYPTNSVE